MLAARWGAAVLGSISSSTARPRADWCPDAAIRDHRDPAADFAAVFARALRGASGRRPLDPDPTPGRHEGRARLVRPHRVRRSRRHPTPLPPSRPGRDGRRPPDGDRTAGRIAVGLADLRCLALHRRSASTAVRLALRSARPGSTCSAYPAPATTTTRAWAPAPTRWISPGTSPSCSSPPCSSPKPRRNCCEQQRAQPRRLRLAGRRNRPDRPGRPGCRRWSTWTTPEPGGYRSPARRPRPTTTTARATPTTPRPSTTARNTSVGRSTPPPTSRPRCWHGSVTAGRSWPSGRAHGVACVPPSGIRSRTPGTWPPTTGCGYRSTRRRRPCGRRSASFAGSAGRCGGPPPKKVTGTFGSPPRTRGEADAWLKLDARRQRQSRVAVVGARRRPGRSTVTGAIVLDARPGVVVVGGPGRRGAAAGHRGRPPTADHRPGDRGHPLPPAHRRPGAPGAHLVADGRHQQRGCQGSRRRSRSPSTSTATAPATWRWSTCPTGWRPPRWSPGAASSPRRCGCRIDQVWPEPAPGHTAGWRGGSATNRRRQMKQPPWPLLSDSAKVGRVQAVPVRDHPATGHRRG